MKGMETTMTAHFILDRALALAGDARMFPTVSPAAFRWLELARRWAKKHGNTELEQAILSDMGQGETLLPEQENAA